MVDFSSPKKQRRSRGNGGIGLFIASLCIIGVVGYALLENKIRASFGGDTPAAEASAS